MKTKQYLVAVAATALVSSFAIAGEVPASAVSTSSASGLDTYLGVGGVYNEYSASMGGQSGNLDLNGFRVVGGINFGNGFSLDARLDNTYGSMSGGGNDSPDTDVRLQDFRALLNYTYDLGQGFSAVGGLGYGSLNLDSGMYELTTEGLLAQGGVKYQSGNFFGSLTYTHLFELATRPYLVAGNDIGLLEASLGYQISESLAATLSVDTQIAGDSYIEKDLGVALGFVYKF